MPVPARPGRGQRLVALEHGGIVDEQAERPERRHGAADQRVGLGLAPEIGLEGDRAAALGHDLADQSVGRRRQLMVVDRDRPTVGREAARDGAADALGGAGDEGGFGHGLGHGREHGRTPLGGSSGAVRAQR